MGSTQGFWSPQGTLYIVFYRTLGAIQFLRYAGHFGAVYDRFCSRRRFGLDQCRSTSIIWMVHHVGICDVYSWWVYSGSISGAEENSSFGWHFVVLWSWYLGCRSFMGILCRLVAYRIRCGWAKT